MGAELGFNIIAGPEWVRVVAALARADERLQHDLRDEIDDEAEKLAEVARRRVQGLPTADGHRKHLFEKVAAGVQVVDRGPGGVRVITSMPTSSEGIIPRGLDRLKGWRHPLFGDKSRWFSNPGYDWFLSTFEHSEGQFERKLDSVLERAAKNIADAGGNNL